MNRQLFINGNAKYPVSTDTLDFIQKQIFLTARLCSLAGSNVIITLATATTDGLVVIDGELLPLLRGTEKSHIQVVETKQSIVAGPQTFQDVRIVRHAEYAYSGTAVSSFTTIQSVVQLMTRIGTVENTYMAESAIRALVQSVQDTLQSGIDTTNRNLSTTTFNLTGLTSRVQTIENNYKTAAQIDDLLAANAQHHLPKGSIVDWYGTCRAAYVPYGFVPCGMFGEDLQNDTQRNSELAAWQSKYHGGITISRTGTNGAFLKITVCCGQEVPDLTDRFIVQAGHNYNLRKTGGRDSVSLTTGEIGLSGIDGRSWSSGGSAASDFKLVKFSGVDTENEFTNFAAGYHENRPPFYALYKLIKVI